MRMRTRFPRRFSTLHGYSTWLRFEAGDELRAEMPEFDSLPEDERNELITKRARRIRLASERPTEREMLQWWEEQPEKDYTCDRCGKTGSKPYVQPQHPYYAEGREGIARCGECVAAINMEARRKRLGQ